MKKQKVLQLIISINPTVQQFDLFEEVARGFSNDSYEFTFGVLTGEPNQDVIDRLNCKCHFFEYKKKQIAGLLPAATSSLHRYIKDKELHYYKVKSFKVESEMALLKAEMAQIKTKSIAIKSEVVSNDSRT